MLLIEPNVAVLLFRIPVFLSVSLRYSLRNPASLDIGVSRLLCRRFHRIEWTPTWLC